MKIAFCVSHLHNPSGGIRIIFEQANRLALRGHEVQIWSIDPFLSQLPFASNVNVLYVPSVFNKKYNRVEKLLFSGTQAFSPDIFIAASSPMAYASSSVPGAKSFWYLQHDEAVACANKYDLKTYQEAFSLPIHFLVNSNWTKEQLKKKYGVDSVIIPYGLDHSLFSPKPPILKTPFPTVLFVYNSQEWKGGADMFEAINHVNIAFPDLRALIISAYIPQGIMVGKGVTIFVRPDQTDIGSIYSSASVFVSSSWYEGFGLPGLEAMACGVPVVSTDSGGVREYAIHEQTALLTPIKNPQALARTIIRVLKEEPLRKRLILSGLQKVKEFDWDKSIDMLEDVFHNSKI